jgi:hypothetical protein
MPLMKSFGIKPIQKWVFSKPGTEWNGMIKILRKIRKLEWKGME